jgi:hypothetical protein
MEIWIVGGIIVALMIYASTKIKRLAADAYAREEIETDAFVIVKPEGFISPVETPYAFEARSKEFGEAEESEEMLRAHATVTIGDTPEPDSVTETERLENGVAVKEFRKVLSRNGRSFELSVIVLADYLDEFEPRVNEMIGSFEVR